MSEQHLRELERRYQAGGSLAEYHRALCKANGHILGSTYLLITGWPVKNYSCSSLGCSLCMRCNQVYCEHARRYGSRPLGDDPKYTRPGEGRGQSASPTTGLTDTRADTRAGKLHRVQPVGRGLGVSRRVTHPDFFVWCPYPRR